MLQQGSNTQLLLSVVVPAFNEQTRIATTLNLYHDYLFNEFGERFEIIVVNDGSTDATYHVVANFFKDKKQGRIVNLASNLGKGAAVKAGILEASRAHFVLFADADGASPIGEEKKLRQALTSGSDIAIGSRALKNHEPNQKAVWNVKAHRHFMGRIFAFIVQVVLGLNVKDTQCGFKMFKQEAAKAIFSKVTLTGFAFDIEVLYLAKKLGFNVQEIATSWSEKPGSKVSLLKDSFKMFIAIFKVRYR